MFLQDRRPELAEFGYTKERQLLVQPKKYFLSHALQRTETWHALDLWIIVKKSKTSAGQWTMPFAR